VKKNRETKYWRGLSEYNKSDKFKHAVNLEFENEVETEEEGKSLISRRQFLSFLTASAALTAAGCSNYKDKGDIVPYNKKPEEITVGVPNYYASTCTGCAENCGTLIKTREGRPIKIDGNPDNPVNKGKICSRGQAGIINLYDPDRIKEPLAGDRAGNYAPVTWKSADDKIIQALNSASSTGKEIAIISNTLTSLTFKKILADFKVKYPSANLYTYELAGEKNFINAFKKSYGINNPQGTEFVIPSVKLGEAKVILALESDFLNTGKNRQENIKLFTENREVITKEKFNKLYSVEGNVSLTGLNSDYRIKLKTDAIEEFVLSLLNEFIVKKSSLPAVTKFAGQQGIEQLLSGFELSQFVKKYSLNSETINELVKDLESNQGSVFVSAGFMLSESTHIAVNLLNEVLGASKLFDFANGFFVLQENSTDEEIQKLSGNLKSGNVSVAVVIDSNPVYHFAKEYGFAESLKKLQTSVLLTEFLNETAHVCNYVLPVSNNLESWGDYKVRAGLLSLQQPVIYPLYNTRQRETIFLNWTKNDITDKQDYFLNYLKENWEKNFYPALNSGTSFRDFWTKSLQDGIVVTQDKVNKSLQFVNESFIQNSGKVKSSKDFAVVLCRSYSLGDGKFANNGWLQELPHPVSKMVWDNYAAISVDSAKELGVDSNDLIEIAINGNKISIPVFVQSGMADKTIAIELGYGRTKAGKVGSDKGFNAVELISKTPAISPWLYNNASISKASGTYELISTQEHYPIDQEQYKDIAIKRGIVREATLDEYRKNPGGVIKEKKIDGLNIVQFPSVNEDHQYTGVKWAMAIDLNKCIGCADCTSACNVENNIPVVGKDQVKANREMHWIRIDRYYSGNSSEPRATFMPMLCQHCDLAPCENVCPVAATTHSEDGINGMAYNRCVGTRYCSNNCPYKVRRYNYFNFRNHLADGHYEQDSVSLVHNPEVTVRSRGVMEKCTFCLQRVMGARQNSIATNTPLKGSDVKTACQEACPSNAISFGDMNDEKDALQQFRKHKLSYTVLEEIKVRPNVTYIAKIRNNNGNKNKA